MCQINSKPVNKKTVKAVRVYRRSPLYPGVVSLFMSQPKPKHRVWVTATNKQFHACKNITGAQKMVAEKNALFALSVSRRFYEVELSGNIHEGRWSDFKSVRTYTADRMRILRRIK